MRSNPRTERGSAVAIGALLLCGLAPGAGAQTRAAARAELKGLEQRAEARADRLMQAVEFAERHELVAEYHRLLDAVLQIDPDHPRANTLKGRVRHRGQWLFPAEVRARVARELEERYATQGMVRLGRVWIEPAHAADARQGIYHHDGEVVNEWEKYQLQAGQVRHPRTGVLIDPEQLPAARNGRFPAGSQGWVGEAAANTYHHDRRRPWVVRASFGWVISTLPLRTIEQQILPTLEHAWQGLQPVFGAHSWHPAHRPVVRIAASTAIFKDLGSDWGGSGSAYGAFLTQSASRVQGSTSPQGVANWGEADWRPYFPRHALGLAACAARFGHRQLAQAPHWLPRAIGGFAERHFSTETAVHFGRQHLAKGGVGELRPWFEGFRIAGDVDPKQIGFHVFQSGLLTAFCLDGGDEAATAAFRAVFQAAPEADLAALATGLRTVLEARSKAVQTYLEEYVR